MFLQNIYNPFGEEACQYVRKFIIANEDLRRALKKKDFLSRCKHARICDKKVLHITNNIYL